LRGDAPDGGKGALAPFHISSRSAASRGTRNLQRSGLAGQLDGDRRRVLALFRDPVHVHQQRGIDVGPVHAGGRLAAADGQRIHHLDGGPGRIPEAIDSR